MPPHRPMTRREQDDLDACRAHLRSIGAIVGSEPTTISSAHLSDEERAKRQTERAARLREGAAQRSLGRLRAQQTGDDAA